MRKILIAVLGAAILLTGCDSGPPCVRGHYQTEVVLENRFVGVDAKGQPKYMLLPTTKQVYYCDEYATEDTNEVG